LLGSIGSTLESEMSRSRVKESFPSEEESWNFQNNDNNDDEGGDDNGEADEPDEYDEEENVTPLRKRRILKY